MGATTFANVGRGATAQEAFGGLVSAARYEYGHGGYTGTIAEKSGFQEFPVPAGVTPEQLVRWVEGFDIDGDVDASEIPAEYVALVRKIYKVWDDKWGPAACLKIADGKWVFFGWASE
jgi:hypothetical protein